jgi:PAS domain S-box-containing protein
MDKRMAPGARILVVEDEGFVAVDLQQVLEGLGYQVDHTAATADEALRCASESLPDLVLMDIHIKGDRDGIEAAAELHSRFGVPIVYLTAYTDAATVERAKRTAPLGYLQKPFSEVSLRTTLEIAFRLEEIARRLRAQERWLAITLKSISEGVISTDAEGRVALMNSAAEALSGWTQAEAAGQPLAALLPLFDPTTGQRAEHPVDHALAGRASSPGGDHKLQMRDQTERIVEVSTSPIVDERGLLLGAVMVFRDVSEARRARQQLELAQRMSALGTMVAGVAHEINNPLTFVTSNLHLALAEIARNPARLAAQGDDGVAFAGIEEALREAALGGERIAQIVAGLKAMVRQPDRVQESADLAEALRWALNVSSAELRQRARVTTALAAVPPVRCDETQLGQVFINLLQNAAQAIPPGEPERHEVHVSARVDGEWVVTEIHDSGSGIPPEHLNHIFEPFFTTKPIGKGTGLGLSICHGIIKSSGGELTATSEVGQGTTFTVRLPFALNLRPAPAPPPALALRGARARLLAIDDEPLILRVVRRILGDEHDVTTLESAAQALDLLASGARFDVILCDLMMPGMTGIDLHESVSRDYPDQAARMVFLSGGARNASSAAFLERFAGRHLDKPFDRSALQALIHRVVSEQTTIHALFANQGRQCRFSAEIT